MSEILAAGDWKNNAELMADVFQIGWLDGDVLDLSYGEGKFWTNHLPEGLVANDLDPEKGDVTFDARTPPFEWFRRFDAVVWDPPYKLQGAPSLGEDDRKYGVDVKRSHGQQFDLILRGAEGAGTCVKLGGWLHVKCQNQILGGKYIDVVRMIVDQLALNGHEEFELRSIWHFVGSIRPQPPGRRQLNPRNNVSQLLSFQKIKYPEAELF